MEQATKLKSSLAWRRYLPPLNWLMDYRPAWLASDLVAGVTLAAYAIPVALAYATLAGLPPQIGIYGYLLGGLGYGGYRAWQRRRWALLGWGVVVLLAMIAGHRQYTDQAQTWIIFGGDGGLFHGAIEPQLRPPNQLLLSFRRSPRCLETGRSRSRSA